jgi:acyl dehydratase
MESGTSGTRAWGIRKGSAMAGLWFEEFVVGRVFEHEIRRTVTEADNVWFNGATCNPAPIHLDAEYCKGTEFGQPLVNSLFSLGLIVGLSVQDTTLGTTVANLGMSDVRFAHPVFAGDTLRARTTVMALRESQSRPGQGIVTLLHQGFNQRGQEVVNCTRQALMLKKKKDT